MTLLGPGGLVKWPYLMNGRKLLGEHSKAWETGKVTTWCLWAA